MIRKAISGIMLILALVGATLTFNIHPAMASGTAYAIYIRSDGSIDPPTAPIQREGDIYAFTDNIEFLSIVVERNNIIIDGNGYALRHLPHEGLCLHQVSNVTVINLEIEANYFGIFVDNSSNNKICNNSIGYNSVGIYLRLSYSNFIYGNNITANSHDGIVLIGSSNNVISGNNITNSYRGIGSYWPSNNIISGNNITNNGHGIALYNSPMELSEGEVIFGNNITNNGYGITLTMSSNNSVYGNNIANNKHGIWLGYESSNNRIYENNIAENGVGWYTLQGDGISLIYNSSANSIYHNNFINNLRQVYDDSWDHSYILPSINAWDSNYPSGGNYWSDYTARYPSAQELDASGIWDTPYNIDENNQDNYPLMELWTPTPPSPTEVLEQLVETVEAWDLPKGTENSLTSKLEEALHALDKGNENGASHKLTSFINHALALRDKKLTEEQADFLISDAQRIIDLINE